MHRRSGRILAVATGVALLCTNAPALTGGPAEPAHAEPSALTLDNLVDPFTGDFHYSLPVVDLPGPQGTYPFVLNYRSGIQTEEEASWVGLGWSLEAGRISRDVRGVPDDVAGDDVDQLFQQRDAVTVGGGGAVGVEVFGFDGLVGAGVNLGLEVFFDTYSGYGMSLNLSPKASVKVSDNLGAQLGVAASLNTKQGATASSTLGLNVGLRQMNPSFGASYSANTGLESAYWGHGQVPLFAPSYVAAATRQQWGSRTDFSVKVGAELWGVFPEGEVSGYYGSTTYSVPPARKAWGYLHLPEGNATNGDQLDYVREKDGPLKPKTPYLPFTVLAHDEFELATSGGPGGSFRAFRNDVTILGDPPVWSTNVSTAAAVEAGLGGLAHVGGSSQGAVAESTSAFWAGTDFASQAATLWADPAAERFYFAMIAEPNTEVLSKGVEYADDARWIQLPDVSRASWNLQSLSVPTSQPLTVKDRRPRATFIRAVTEAEATTPAWASKFTHAGIVRPSGVPGTRIGGFEVVAPDGTIYVFAQPAYVTSDVQCTLSVDPAVGSSLMKGEATIALGSSVMQSIASWLQTRSPVSVALPETTDKFVSCTRTPPYAHSYHLTAVLGPGYLDVDGIPGPSDRDLGHWVRFEYVRVSEYAYRSPFRGAHYQRGYETSYLVDDRASFTYGTKELYFLQRAFTASHEVLFELEDRSDARGAASLANDSGTGAAQKRLRKVTLKRRGDKIPIRTATLEHTYDLARGVPNSAGGNDGGKLTLTKVYFTDGKDTSGQYSPFQFSYDVGDGSPRYRAAGRDGDTSSDRWGFFQPCYLVTSYPVPGDSGTCLTTSASANAADRCSNVEQPYTRQDSSAAAFASAWNLRRIVVPSGARIDVTYEPDDYAFVQDERAAIMVPGCDVAITPETSAPTLCIDLSKLPNPPATQGEAEARMRRLLRGAGGQARQLAFKAELRLRKGDAGEMWGPVSGYVDVRTPPGADPFTVSCTSGMCRGWVLVKAARDKYDPIAYAGWQHLKLNQPQYAIPGVSPMCVAASTSDQLEGAARGLVNMVQDVWNAFDKFDERAAAANWSRAARNVLVRMYEPTGFKRGGGSRVKSLTACDVHAGSGVDCSDPQYAVGKTFEYTIDEDGERRSSGVAAYEPSVGGDEISLRRAEIFEDQNILAPDDPAYFEHPVAEALYPAPVVGYRRVVERTLAGAYAMAHPTLHVSVAGERVHEFYTAKDFPVRTRASVIAKPTPVQDLFQMPGIGVLLHEEFAASQGYRVELNDMHGKPRRVAEYALKDDGSRADGVDRETVYVYNVANTDRGRLEPRLPRVHRTFDAPLASAFGQRVEYWADLRQSTSSTSSAGVSVNVDTLQLLYPVPIPVPWPSYDDSLKVSRTAVFHQVVHRNGVLLSIDRRDGSARTTTNHVAFDMDRASPVLTSQTNAFGDAVYDLTIPAHWLHPAMGASYADPSRPNLLSADGVRVRTMLDQLTRPVLIHDCAAFKLGGVLDASLTIHSNRTRADNDLVARHTGLPAKGTCGVCHGPPQPWRPVATYRYETSRTYSADAANPDPSTDGRFAEGLVLPSPPLARGEDEIATFEALIPACMPKWRRTERISKHHPHGPQIEAETPLDRKDAALFGRKASVVQAVARNAAYAEVGYEGFESYTSGEELAFEDLDDGNIDFWADARAWLVREIPWRFQGRVVGGRIVWERGPKTPDPGPGPDPLPDILITSPKAKGKQTIVKLAKVMREKSRIVGIPSKPIDLPAGRVTVHMGAPVTFRGARPATAKAKGPVKPKGWEWLDDVTIAAPKVMVTGSVAHTGARALSVHGNVTFPQTRLRPRPGTYVLGGWVRRADTDVQTYAAPPEAVERIGIGVVVGGTMDPAEVTTGGRTVLVEPSGPIIDGWQRVEGEFTYAANDLLSLVIQGGDEVIYVDDVRIFPRDASLATFVYDDRRQVVARLDENNFATRWQYDAGGRLRFAERETERGWRTVREHVVHQAESR
jgi:YD repeat-containing protein